MDNGFEDRKTYKAVVNQEDQHSIWPLDKANPPGWRDTGKSGSKSECLAYIREAWIDITPLNLRHS